MCVCVCISFVYTICISISLLHESNKICKGLLMHTTEVYSLQRLLNSLQAVCFVCCLFVDNEHYTVGHSRTILTRLINPSDLAHHGYCKG